MAYAFYNSLFLPKANIPAAPLLHITKTEVLKSGSSRFSASLRNPRNSNAVPLSRVEIDYFSPVQSREHCSQRKKEDLIEDLSSKSSLATDVCKRKMEGNPFIRF